jgi:hypothetical protein
MVRLELLDDVKFVPSRASLAAVAFVLETERRPPRGTRLSPPTQSKRVIFAPFPSQRRLNFAFAPIWEVETGAIPDQILSGEVKLT